MRKTGKHAWPMLVVVASASSTLASFAIGACSSSGDDGPPRVNGCIGAACYDTGTNPGTDGDSPSDGGAGDEDGPIVYGDPLAGTSKTGTLVKGGYGFTEGPVWIGNRLIFSDTAQNMMFSMTDDGTATVFRQPSRGANGNAVDAHGLLITCQGNAANLVRTDATLMNPVAIASTFNGKAFDSPNDVVARADGNIYFTDPFYGTIPDGGLPQDKMAVYRLPPAVGAGGALRLAFDFKQPNGIALSVDGNALYVVDSGNGKVLIAGLNTDGSLSGSFLPFVDAPGGDGMGIDLAGNVYVAATDGVLVFDIAGKALGTITVPGTASNVSFGGADHKKLFITVRKPAANGAVDPATGIYAITLNVPGLP